jgi:hypothetical protein
MLSSTTAIRTRRGKTRFHTHTDTHIHTICSSSSYLSIRVSDIRCGEEIELDVASGDSSVLDFHDEVLAIS